MSYHGASTTMMPSITDRMSSSDYLSSSNGSMSASHHARQQASYIAKTYRQAAQLFLTRRLPEALSTIEPIITPPAALNSNVHHNDSDYEGQQEQANGENAFAPIATASKGTRVKVWSFYLTFLNAVIELGPEEGKHAFGSTKWRNMVNKARDGSIWEEVVQFGYHGNEGAVDHDVVINLATLLLTHSPSQKLTQTRLETYLSALSNPTFDISAHMQSSDYLRRSKHLSHRFSSASAASGTNTPRDLATHLKLLELYTLHVLPRNGEWDYAREFIMMSEVMDDERKETFLQALHGLKEEQENQMLREREIARQQKEQAEQQRRQEELERRQEEQRRMEEERRRREEARSRPSQRPPDSSYDRARPVTPTRGPRSALSPAANSPRSTQQPKKAVSRKQAPASVLARFSHVFSALQSTLLATANGLRNNPLALLRTLLFMLAIALAFGRREIRERVKRLLTQVGTKLQQTVGMGVKVSYI